VAGSNPAKIIFIFAS